MIRAKRATAAALVILIVGITAGVGPGRHTCVPEAVHTCENGCVPQTLSPASGLRITTGPEARRLARDQSPCLACLLRAQFSSLTFSIVPQVAPLHESIGLDTDRHPLPAYLFQLDRNARAPPNAPPESGTV